MTANEATRLETESTESTETETSSADTPVDAESAAAASIETEPDVDAAPAEAPEKLAVAETEATELEADTAPTEGAEDPVVAEAEAAEPEADTAPTDGAEDLVVAEAEAAEPEADTAPTDGAEDPVVAEAEAAEPEVDAAPQDEPEELAVAETGESETSDLEAAQVAAEAVEATTPAADDGDAEPVQIETSEATDSEEPKATPTEPSETVATPESQKVVALRSAREAHDTVEGKVIGWNNGGFHVVVADVTAFCPRSEIEIGAPQAPEKYLDKELTFHVLNVQKKGKRVVLSRASVLRGERAQVREDAKKRLAPGSVVTGTVASLTDFGAFIDVGGGIHGLVHVSEISRTRVESPADVLEVGQEVEVQVLKLEKGGKRISLSMRALQPDPWREVREKFPEGSVVTGTVEKATSVGAFIELEPGLVGLLPTSAMSIPREASPARVYHAGKQIKVTIMGVDSRRQRISLALEGSTSGGTRGDFQNYVKQQRGSSSGSGGGFNALADALKKLQSSAD